MFPIGGFKKCFLLVGATSAQKMVCHCNLIIHLTIIFAPKFKYFFLQLNEIRDEAETWWLDFGPNVASSQFFLKENLHPTSITRVSVLLTVTVNM